MYYDANERLPLNNIFGEKIVKVYIVTYFNEFYAEDACRCHASEFIGPFRPNRAIR